MSDSKKSWFCDLLAIFLASSILYLGFAFLRPIFNPDEGRYAEIPREMMASGDYVTPKLNGFPYFYKPPLFYWMQCASFKMFGFNRSSIRLASSLMAVLGICMGYAVARVLHSRRAGFFTAAVLASSLFYYAIGQIVTLDMTVSVFMSAAMFAFFIALKKSGLWRDVLVVAFWVFCALAVMTKGVIGVMIPCVVAFLFVICTGVGKFCSSISRRDFIFTIIGLFAFFAIVFPWHFAVCLANPALDGAEGIFSKNPAGQGFFWYYFVHEHFLRFVDSSTALREQPFWFFIVLAPVGFIPWVFLLPRAVWNLWRAENGKFRDVVVFVSVWVLFVIGFFSISSSKLIPYITAIYPAFALIVGMFFAQVWDKLSEVNLRVEKWAMIVLGFASSIAFPVAYFILAKRNKLEDDVLSICFYGALITSLAMLVVSFSALYFARRRVEKNFWLSVFAGIFVLCASFNVNAAMAQGISSEKLAKKIIELRNGEQIAIAFNYGRFHDLPIWLNETLLFIGEPPLEQSFGWKRERHLHRHRVLTDAVALKNFLLKNKKLWVVMQDKHNELLNSFNLPLQQREIARNKHTSVREISLKDEK